MRSGAFCERKPDAIRVSDERSFTLPAATLCVREPGVSYAVQPGNRPCKVHRQSVRIVFRAFNIR
jgi:hypothetical protein